MRIAGVGLLICSIPLFFRLPNGKRWEVDVKFNVAARSARLPLNSAFVQKVIAEVAKPDFAQMVKEESKTDASHCSISRAKPSRNTSLMEVRILADKDTVAQQVGWTMIRELERRFAAGHGPIAIEIADYGEPVEHKTVIAGLMEKLVRFNR